MLKVEVEYWLFNKIVSLFDEYKSEITLQFTKDGLKVVAMDDPRVAQIRLFIDKSNFKSYEPLGDPIKISMKQLKERLRGVFKDINIVTLEIDLIKSNQLKMEIATPYGHSVRGVPILEPEERELSDAGQSEPSKITKDVMVKAFVGAVIDAVTDAERVEMMVHFEGRKDPDRFVLWATKAGEFLSSWSEFEDKKSIMGLRTTTPKTRTASGVAYPAFIMKAGALFTDVVKIWFGDDTPIAFEFQLPFEGYLKFFVAPWIEKD